MGDAPGGQGNKMTRQEKALSYELDRAREMEAHYRALLLFWKQRRQHLEAQLPTDNIFSQILEVAQQAWSKNERSN